VLPPELTRAAETLASLWSRLAGRLPRWKRASTMRWKTTISLQRDELEAWQMAVGGMLVRAEGVLALWRDFAADAPRVATAGALAQTRADDDPLSGRSTSTAVISSRRTFCGAALGRVPRVPS
jgi:hypothetical protein